MHFCQLNFLALSAALLCAAVRVTANATIKNAVKDLDTVIL